MDAEDALIAVVGARLKKLRNAAGLTQETMAARIECGLRNYQRLETGQVNMSLRTVARLASALSLSPAELFAGAQVFDDLARTRSLTFERPVAHLRKTRG